MYQTNAAVAAFLLNQFIFGGTIKRGLAEDDANRHVCVG